MVSPTLFVLAQPEVVQTADQRSKKAQDRPLSINRGAILDFFGLSALWAKGSPTEPLADVHIFPGGGISIPGGAHVKLSIIRVEDLRN